MLEQEVSGSAVGYLFERLAIRRQMAIAAAEGADVEPTGQNVGHLTTFAFTDAVQVAMSFKHAALASYRVSAIRD